jgi:hypothetical protein
VARLKWQAREHPFYGIEVYVVETHVDGTVLLGWIDEDGRVALREVEPHTEHQPTFRMTVDEARGLMGALSRAGIRAPEAEWDEARSTGQLEECRKRADFLERLIVTSRLGREPDLQARRLEQELAEG